jgi:lipopolysaccharide transport system permease protein
VRVITARPPGIAARLKEVWTYRRLVAWFGKAVVERMYANTKLGWWWLPLRPILSVVPRAVIFGGVLKAPSEGIPYLLFFVVGTGAWDMFFRGWFIGTRSLQMFGRYLRRMYLPRLVPVVASAASGLAEFLLYLTFGVFVTIYYTFHDGSFPLHFGLNTLMLPFAVLAIVLLGLSLSLWTSIPGMHGRDARWTVRAILHVWMLLTPVIYPLSAVPAQYQKLDLFNPMTAPMEAVRKSIFDKGTVTVTGVTSTVVAILVIGGFGLVFFNRREAAAVDAS